MSSLEMSAPSPPASPSPSWRAVLRMLRPSQWTKNIIILVPLVFAHKAFHALSACRALQTMFAFGLLSGAIYIFNDLSDRAVDRLHPVKCHRPIASGRISPIFAVIFGVGLATVALAWLAVVGFKPFLAGAGYLILQIAYIAALKQVVILDVIIIASGFVIRVAAGALAVEVPISNWLYICTFLLALFLGFSKRRAELVLMKENAGAHRRSLNELSLPLLDQLIGAVTASTIVSYALYTMSEETVRKFGSDRLKFTVPCVIYGIFRYLYLLYRKNEGGSPERLLLSDLPLIFNILVFCLVVGLVLYA